MNIREFNKFKRKCSLCRNNNLFTDEEMAWIEEYKPSWMLVSGTRPVGDKGYSKLYSFNKEKAEEFINLDYKPEEWKNKR